MFTQIIQLSLAIKEDGIWTIVAINNAKVFYFSILFSMFIFLYL